MARKAAAKRKLSTTAVDGRPEGIKKTKSQEPPPSSKTEPEKTTDNVSDNEAKDTKAVSIQSEERKHADDPQGKATFYLWADALSPWLDDSPEELVFRLKSAVHDAWSHLKEIPEEEREESDLVCEQADRIDQWYVEEVEHDDEVKQGQARKMKELAQKICDDFDAKPSKDKKQESSKDKGAEGDGDKHEPEEKFAEDGWWWQLVLQRTRPADDSPAVEVKLSKVSGRDDGPYGGQWWWTGLCPGDENGALALTLMTDYLAGALA
ncbi:hypothetical protein BDY19DRAFT_902560 [Irpex rosettiformis]|uniref:Uncharacterized protein n=1 Tax=Irpex rosettiformis TaxID=378272 RepID=A0ACB8UHL9_9APHY|nr:hypothetical protein BDY19DRAFT_902560 [Irpex rosettiformis]